MAQTYKSYDFYGLSGSDNDEKPNKAATPSRLSQKQEKKKIDKAAKQESSDSSSGDDEKPIVKGPPKDLESEYGSKNGKKVKKDDSANKKKNDDIQASSASKITPDNKGQNSNANLQKGEQIAPAISQNTSLQTAPVENTSTEPMNIESQNIETSRVEDNVSNIPGKSNNESVTQPTSELGYSDNNIPANVITSTVQTPSTPQPVTTQSNEGVSSAQPAKLQFREDREPASVQSKKKSGKYNEATSSESSLSPQRSPKNVPKPAVASVEARQKSKLSSHLKSIRESMKAQEQEQLDPELNVVNTLPGDKPKFFVDTTPIGIIQEEGETKKLVTQGTEMEVEVEERQYRILGQERAFRTGGKNLVEKLNKFFIDKEEEKKEEELKEGDEDMKEVEEEFNFESRYFMYNPTKVCNRCKKAGHFERWCPEDVLIKCMFCVGHHRTDECTQVVCFQCYGVGHRARDCDAPGSLVCFRCGKRGHKSTNCGMIVLKESTLYREKKDGSGDIKCMKCGRYGHSKCNKGSEKDKKKQHERDSLYDEEREELNMKVLSRARDVQSYEFEGSISGESYEDLSNFAPASRSKYEQRSRERREKEIMNEIKREKRDRKDRDREKHYKKKKSKRYY